MKPQVNYTDAMVKEMVEKYQANPTKETVEALAVEMGKSVKSVIAKLSREGVYQKQARLNKAGQPAVRKAQLVAVISKMVGREVETLEKASKQDLIRVANALAEAQNLVEAREVA